ncbi:hypothetical protein O6P43_026773 [Quillaja saponaria]|uniref:Uncharacterized protein n=1 Tax=Quillaja saponaria TaxID=32244 RepID=A0AAD7L2Y0_QUISA|nr:hypothetical protein O6P43_026773 [Quillaja saponaria]
MFKYVGNSTFKIEMYNKTRFEKKLCGPITSDDQISLVVGIDEKKEVKQKLDYLEDDQILKMRKSSMFVANPTQSEGKKGTTVDENGADPHDAGSKGTDGDGSERTEVINIDEEIGSGKSLKSCNADVPRMRKHKEGTSSSDTLQEAKTLRFRVILEHDLVPRGVQVLKMPSDLFTRLGRELKKVVLKDLVSDKLWEVDVKKDEVTFVCRPTKCEDTKSKTVVGNGASEAKRTQPNEDEGKKRSISESLISSKDDQQAQVKSKAESELKRKRIDVDDHEIYRMQKRSEPVANSTEYEGIKGYTGLRKRIRPS